MRVFVAVPLDDETRHRLSRLLAMRVAEMPGRPVQPANWHLTLRFLGEIDEVARDRVVAGLDRADLGKPFTLGWSALGAFPRASRATVLWIDVARGRSELEGVAEAVAGALEGAGFSREDRPFRPHMTLSRIRPPRDVSTIVDGPPLGVRMPVDRVALYRSRPGRGGPQYSVVEEFPLS